MIVFEFKVKAKSAQYAAIDEAIRTAQFVRNKCLRYWMDNQGINKYDLNKYCRVLAKEFSFAAELNSQARQSSAERAWSAISRLYENCRNKFKSPKGFPRFKKNCRSVEYKTSGWKLSENRKAITFTDKKRIGRLKLKGTYDLNFYQLDQIKRVRLVRRADGYYAQFAVKADLRIKTKPTGRAIGLDLGIKYFLADSNGKTEKSPKFYRCCERQLSRANRKKSKKYRRGAKLQSKNYHKSRKRYARKHLRVSRQRKEYCKRVAYSVIQSNDLVAYVDAPAACRRLDLNVKGLVRNRHLSKSISDAGWSTFRRWLEYFGHKYGKVTVAVPPQYTSQDCPKCHHRVKKSLSQRTHVCGNCGFVEDRDIAASLNILQKGLSTAGHVGNYAWGDLPSWAVGAILSSNGESENQESSSIV